MKKRSVLNAEIVSTDGMLSLSSKPKRDKDWLIALEGIEHANQNGIVLINGTDFETVKEKLCDSYNIQICPHAFRVFMTVSPKTCTYEKRPLPASIHESAFKFQREDIQQAIHMHNGRCFLAHDMGCGKTMISLGVIAQYRTHDSRHLIITPSYLRSSWWNEVSKWLNVDAGVIFKTKDKINLNPFVIISYDLAVRKLKELAAVHWTTITCDESHYLKSRNAKRTKLLSPILQRCEHVLLLSGTPALSRPCELFTQLQILHPRVFKQYTAFARRYCDLKKTVWGWDSSGSTNPDELSVIMEQCMVRRLKRNVLKDLPQKIRKKVRIPLSQRERKELETQFAKLKQMNDTLNKVVIANEETRTLAFQRQALISEMFRATARAKLKGMCDYVKGTCEDNADHKIILFGFHQITMDALEELVSIQLKERFIRIDGKTPQQERQPLVDKFQHGDARIAILSIGACNSGLTLTACHHTVFCELTWTPSLLLQCEDRTHRISQEHVCQYDYLCAQDSLDERVMHKVQNKFGLLDQIIDKKQNADGFDVAEYQDFERDLEDSDSNEPEYKRQKVEQVDTVDGEEQRRKAE